MCFQAALFPMVKGFRNNFFVASLSVPFHCMVINLASIYLSIGHQHAVLFNKIVVNQLIGNRRFTMRSDFSLRQRAGFLLVQGIVV